MEGKKKPFALHAARCSTILPLAIIVFNLYTSRSSATWQQHQAIAVTGICLVLYIVGIALAILAFRGIRVHGPVGIRGFAIAGLILNSIILLLTIFIITVLINIKMTSSESISNSQTETVLAILREDVMQIQTSGTVPVRTFSPEEYGNLAPMLQRVNDGLVFQMKATETYNRKIYHINLDSYLQPQQLLNLNSIAYSREQVRLLQRSYQDFISVLTEHMCEHLREIMALDLPAQVKTGFLEGYNNAMIRNRELLAKLKDVHYNYTQAIIALLSFMETKINVCSLEENTIIFEEDSDCEQFNMLYTKIIDLGNELTNLAEQSQLPVQEILETSR